MENAATSHYSQNAAHPTAKTNSAACIVTHSATVLVVLDEPRTGPREVVTDVLLELNDPRQICWDLARVMALGRRGARAFPKHLTNVPPLGQNHRSRGEIEEVTFGIDVHRGACAGRRRASFCT